MHYKIFNIRKYYDIKEAIIMPNTDLKFFNIIRDYDLNGINNYYVGLFIDKHKNIYERSLYHWFVPDGTTESEENEILESMGIDPYVTIHYIYIYEIDNDNIDLDDYIKKYVDKKKYTKVDDKIASKLIYCQIDHDIDEVIRYYNELILYNLCHNKYAKYTINRLLNIYENIESANNWPIIYNLDDSIIIKLLFKLPKRLILKYFCSLEISVWVLYYEIDSNTSDSSASSVRDFIKIISDETFKFLMKNPANYKIAKKIFKRLNKLKNECKDIYK